MGIALSLSLFGLPPLRIVVRRKRDSGKRHGSSSIFGAEHDDPPPLSGHRGVPRLASSGSSDSRRATPGYGRFTYWEKFDYFAVFWGMIIIGFTGLVLWFPEFFTRILPGWSINVATIIHSDEALLAVGFIFTIHFFNTHFRPDKFPGVYRRRRSRGGEPEDQGPGEAADRAGGEDCRLHRPDDWFDANRSDRVIYGPWIPVSTRCSWR